MSFMEIAEAYGHDNFQLIIHDERIREWGGLAPATPGAAAIDLFACIDMPVVIYPGRVAVIDAGFSLWIRDPRYVALLFPRSGNGVKRGLVLANGTGVIDSDYQGRWKVPLLNRTIAPQGETQTISPGDRIAQFVIQEVYHPSLKEVSAFDVNSIRGVGGFGSTGLSSAHCAS